MSRPDGDALVLWSTPCPRSSALALCPRLRSLIPPFVHPRRAYLDRWQLYRRRQWTCTVTGKSGLTYEEALNSERKSKEELRERIPDALQRQILLAVQYNMTSRIDKLTEDIAEHMRFRFCTGETLQMALPGEKESPTYV